MYKRDLFTGTAHYYARYRVPYPEPLFDHMRQKLALDGNGRLLDLGCGTGQLATSLAKNFQEVVAMDPQEEMLVECRNIINDKKIANINVVIGSSEDLNRLKTELGTFRLVTMGRSFHWMNQAQTLADLDPLIKDGGSIVIVATHVPKDDPINYWRETVKSVVQRWLGAKRRAGSGYYVEPEERFEEFLAKSAFKKFEPYTYLFQRTLDIDAIVGQLYSTSYCSREVLGDKQPGFEKDLRETLLGIEPSGQLTEVITADAILAWRV